MHWFRKNYTSLESVPNQIMRLDKELVKLTKEIETINTRLAELEVLITSAEGRIKKLNNGIIDDNFQVNYAALAFGSPTSLERSYASRLESLEEKKSLTAKLTELTQAQQEKQSLKEELERDQPSSSSNGDPGPSSRKAKKE